MSKLPRSTPFEQSVPMRYINNFVQKVEDNNIILHSFMICKNDYVISQGFYKPYCEDDLHHIYSFSKSFVSTAIGMLLDEKRLSLDDKVADYFKEKITPIADKRVYLLTIEHLLKMSAGCTCNEYLSIFKGDWVAKYLNSPFFFTPGEAFHYNSINTYILSAIVKKLTGVGVSEYLRIHLLSKMDINNFKWQMGGDNIEAGGWGLNITTEDLMKFCLLYKNKGVYKGKRLLSQEWVELATSKHIDNSVTSNGEKLVINHDNIAGYGYQFWINHDENGYRCDGMFGQYGIVIPELDLVVVTTAGQGPANALLDLVFDTIINPLLEDKKNGISTLEYSQESGVYENLSLLKCDEITTSPMESKINNATYFLPRNIISAIPFLQKAINQNFTRGINDFNLSFSDDICLVEWHEGGSLHNLVAPKGNKSARATLVFGENSYIIEANGNWVSENEYDLTLFYINTPHSATLKFTFLNNGESVSVLNLETPPLKEALSFAFDIKMASVPHSNQILAILEKEGIPVIGLKQRI